MLTIIPWARVDLLFFSLNIDVNLFLVFFSFFFLPKHLFDDEVHYFLRLYFKNHTALCVY